MDKSKRKDSKGSPAIGRQSASKLFANSRENIVAARRKVLAPINSFKIKSKSKKNVRKISFSNGNSPSPDKFSSQESLPGSSRDSTLSMPGLRPSNPLLNFPCSDENLYDSEESGSPTLRRLSENEAELGNTVHTTDDEKTVASEDSSKGADTENTNLPGESVENTDSRGAIDENTEINGADEQNTDTKVENTDTKVENTDTTGKDEEITNTTVAEVKSKRLSNKFFSFIVRFFSCI